MKFIVWGLILFGAYSAWAYLPVWSTKNTISRAATNAAADIKDSMSPEVAALQVVRRAKVSSLDLSEAPIEVTWERAKNERIVHVSVQYPVTISYLGSERVVDTDVYVTESVWVDEAAEASLAARKQWNQKRVEKIQRANQAIQGKKRRAIADCEEETGQKCEITGFGGSGYAYTDEDQYELKKRY